MIATAKPTLEQFLARPDTKPASEFINGQIFQKPMPQGEHSLLQAELCKVVNAIAKSDKIAHAFPELRCTFGGQSMVPDIAVFKWHRIPLTTTGRIANRFTIHPDWAIEILSPGQSETRVLGNLLHCSEHGTALGWLLDPDEESILAVFPEQRVKIFTGDATLPMLDDLDLTLTAKQIFSWLML